MKTIETKYTKNLAVNSILNRYPRNQKQEQLQKQKDIYKPVPYRKSTRLPDNRPTQPIQTTNEIKDDFAANTWLYD